MQDPQPDFRPRPGEAETLAPDLRRIVAPNPSPMTFRGTNTYLLGTRGLAVIDPGPDDLGHLDAILSALTPGQRITHVLVTHAHLDHSPLARPLAQATGAQVHAFGDAGAGRSGVMRKLARDGLLGGGEGVDAGFAPDVCLRDKDCVTGDGWQIEALHTPGHFGNHLSFAWGDALFSGDLVMGWASSLVSPPDGDLTDFMASLDRIAARSWSVLHPGHGAPIETPGARIAELRVHRLNREAQILAALEDGAADAATLAARIYTDTPPALLPAATRNVLSHLLHMAREGPVTAPAGLTENAIFQVT